MKARFVELGRMALDMAQRLLAQQHDFIDFGPNSEPVAYFSDPSALQSDAGLDAAGWMDAWLGCGVLTA